MANIRVEPIGRERQPVAIIDDFAPDPEALRAVAAERSFAPDGTYYPGLKAPVTRRYFDGTGATLAAVLHDVFGYTEEATILGAWYQLVTTPPAALSLMQRLPHVDAVKLQQIAVVHYLSPGDHGGTAFYRHRATGFETVDAARQPSFYAALNAEVAKAPPSPAYIGDGAPWFERIAAFEPAFNRALVYRSQLLHSGLIAADAVLSPDPLVGRLTVGCFLGP